MNPRLYPFNRSLRQTLRTVEAPAIGVRLVDALMVKLGTTQSETEVLIVVASYRKTASFDQVCDNLTYLTRDKVKRCLLALAAKNHVFTQSVIDHDDFIYSAGESARAAVASITLDALETIAPSAYLEAIVDIEPEVPELVEPVVVVQPIPEPVQPVISDALERAMAFAYSILAPGVNANDVIARNSLRAAAAHRAFYERKPHDLSYDDMMTSLPKPAPAPTPAPVPAPKVRVSLLTALINAFKEWSKQ